VGDGSDNKTIRRQADAKTVMSIVCRIATMKERPTGIAKSGTGTTPR
jgi:hypothetical protein